MCTGKKRALFESPLWEGQKCARTKRRWSGAFILCLMMVWVVIDVGRVCCSVANSIDNWPAQLGLQLATVFAGRYSAGAFRLAVHQDVSTQRSDRLFGCICRLSVAREKSDSPKVPTKWLQTANVSSIRAMCIWVCVVVDLNQSISIDSDCH